MKLKMSLFILVLFATACSLANSTLDNTHTDSVTASSTSVPTFATLTKSQTSTATITTVTSTPISVPGIMSHDQLQDRVNDWINGNIPFDDSDRLLDEVTAEELRLGLLAEPVFDMVIFNFYNLGFTEVEDEDGEIYIINIVGFEDAFGERFTLSFHLGRLSNECQIIHLQLFEGRRVNHARIISFDQLAPIEFLKRTDELIYRVNSAITYADARGRTGNQCVDDVDHYYDSAIEITEALVAFFGCADCKISDVTPVLSEWLNVVPEEFDPRIPYIRFYDVSYW